MGMSTHVVGFRPPDEKWRKMKQVYDACTLAGIEVPEAVEEFFDGEPPDEAGVAVDLEKHPCCHPCRPHDDAVGFDVDVRKLPKDVTILRFYNSW